MWTIAPSQGEPELVLGLLDNVASPPELYGSYAGKPIPSPDGRHLLVCLTRAVHEDPEKAAELKELVARGELGDLSYDFRREHVTCVIDLEQGIVHQAPGRHFHDATWL